MSMTECDKLRAENKTLTGVRCCNLCHSIPMKRTPNWVCCKIDHHIKLYKPSTAKVSLLKS
jgi:hypothetical protein